MIVDPETRRKGIENLVKAGLAIVFFAATASYAWLALEGMIAWACVGGGLMAAWVLGPAIAERAANWRIAQLKAAVEANPIEAMQNIYGSKLSELQAQSTAITEVDTQYRNVQGMVEGLKKTDPEEAKSYIIIVDKIHEGLGSMETDYAYADSQLKQYKGQIDKAQRIWNVAVAINKALAVSEKARADVFRDIKQQVAFDTVTTNLNRAFAKLDTSVREHKQTAFPPTTTESKELPPATEVIDLGNVKSTRVKVSA